MRLKLPLFWLSLATIIMLMKSVHHVGAVNDLYIDIGPMVKDGAPPDHPELWPYGDVDGMKGWLFVPETGQAHLVDSASNSFEVWCVDPDGSLGSSGTYNTDEKYGMRFIKPTVSYWVAKCPYGFGHNFDQGPYVYFLDNDNDGKFTNDIDTFTGTWWQSRDANDDDDDGFQDVSVYEYNVQTNTLSYFLYENGEQVYTWTGEPPTIFGNLPFSRGRVGHVVGGVWVPVDKFGLLAPYIGLASTIVVAMAASACMHASLSAYHTPIRILSLHQSTGRGKSKKPKKRRGTHIS